MTRPESQISINWHRVISKRQPLSPVQPNGYLDPSSPDMFSPSNILMVRNDLFPVESSGQSTISPSMLGMPRLTPPIEYNALINSSIHSENNDESNGMEWYNDGANEEMIMHINAYENKWEDDGEDDDLSHHMDAIECCGIF